MREVWFTVEYFSRGGEWHLFDGPFATLRQARVSMSMLEPKEEATKVRRVVEHRVRD